MGPCLRWRGQSRVPTGGRSRFKGGVQGLIDAECLLVAITRRRPTVVPCPIHRIRRGVASSRHPPTWCPNIRFGDATLDVWTGNRCLEAGRNRSMPYMVSGTIRQQAGLSITVVLLHRVASGTRGRNSEFCHATRSGGAMTVPHTCTTWPLPATPEYWSTTRAVSWFEGTRVNTVAGIWSKQPQPDGLQASGPGHRDQKIVRRQVGPEYGSLEHGSERRRRTAPPVHTSRRWNPRNLLSTSSSSIAPRWPGHRCSPTPQAVRYR